MWEYLVLDHFVSYGSKSLEEFLDERGRDGWELISCVVTEANEHCGFPCQKYSLIFKQPLETNND